uniref:UDENN domain-containing protein n=1 Tax=Rhabditophanes sp. KR3021 TaxID=114890 RepID=A0AC35TZF9_9BILA
MNSNNAFNDIKERYGSLPSLKISSSKNSFKDVEESRCWQIFEKWFHSMCIVTFDLEIGQNIEFIYPGERDLSVEEKSNICYMSFPDSHSAVSQDTTYHFRLSRTGNNFENSIENDYANDCPLSILPYQKFLYGYVHFRQQKNTSLPRGYYQKSVVILSSYPLHELFYKVVDIISMAYFEAGEEAIKSACRQIDEWSKPQPGQSIGLPLLGNIIHCRIPHENDAPQRHFGLPSNSDESYLSPVKLQTVHELNIYSYLKSVTNHLSALWEIVLTGEPLIVMAPSPAICAPLVESLVSLIWPLRYGSDYRPFFTIHDPDFRSFTCPEKIPSVILGVTNPFFNKSLRHFPHILRVGDINIGNNVGSEKNMSKLKVKALDAKPGFFSSYKAVVNNDKHLLKQLIKTGNRPDEAQNKIIRKHFIELTQSFMIPLERYITTLMPLHKNISLFNPIPQISGFVVEDFLQSLSDINPLASFGFKGDLGGLYRKFLKSANFYDWLPMRCKQINDQLESTFYEVMNNVDVGTLHLAERDHVQVVDLVLKMCKRLISLPETDNLKKAKLKSQLNDVLACVEDDLQSVLLSNISIREIFEFNHGNNASNLNNTNHCNSNNSNNFNNSNA